MGSGGILSLAWQCPPGHCLSIEWISGTLDALRTQRDIWHPIGASDYFGFVLRRFGGIGARHYLHITDKQGNVIRIVKLSSMALYHAHTF